MRSPPLARTALAALLVSSALAACGTSSTAAVSTPRSFYGVVPETALTKTDFARMGHTKVGSLRFQAFWPAIEPAAPATPGAPHVYDWSGSDATVDGAESHGIRLLPVLFGTPSWVSGCDPADRICQRQLPVDDATQRHAWASFVEAAAKRYGPHGNYKAIYEAAHPKLTYHPIHNWQIWNEQNNVRLLASPTTYAKLVTIAHRELTGVDPGAKVTLGGMFGTPNGSTRPSDTSWGFLSGLYNHGLKRDFDTVAIHPYSPNIKGVVYQVKRIRKVIAHHHDPKAKIAFTELGWGSDRRHTSGQELVKTPQQQKDLLKRSFRLLKHHRRRWRIDAVYWFSWRDPSPTSTGLCGFCYSTGLLKSNGEAKPAFLAYKRFAQAAR